MIGLETWGDRVKEDLVRTLDDGTGDEPAQAGDAGSWLLQESIRLEQFVEERAHGFAGMREDVKTLVRFAVGSGGSPFACVLGTSGCGKSAVFARLVRLLHKIGIFCLAHATGSGGRSTQVDAILSRWVEELRVELGLPANQPAGADRRHIEKAFAALLTQAASRRRVVCLIDGLDGFEPTRAGQYLTWLPALWPDKARLIATTTESSQLEVLRRSRDARVVTIGGLDRPGAKDMARNICRVYHKQPQADAVGELLRRYEKEPLLPLWLKLAMERLLLLDEDDFDYVDKGEGSRPRLVSRLMLKNVAEFPIDLDAFYRYDIERTGKTYGNDWTRTIAGLIALSRVGWRQSDLREMAPGAGGIEWNDHTFAFVRRGFRAHMAQRGPFGQWDFAHTQMRPAITSGGVVDEETALRWHGAIVRHLESLPGGDPVRQSELMYHHVRAGDAAAAARYYAQITSEAEVDSATRTLGAELVSGESQTGGARFEWTLSLLNAPGLNMLRTSALCTRYLYHLLPAAGEDLSVKGRLAIVMAVRVQLLKVRERYGHMLPIERQLAVTSDRLGDLYIEADKLELARAAFEDGLAIREAAQRDFGDPALKLDLSISHSRLGDIHCRLKNTAQALDHYMLDVRMTTEMHATDPANEDYLRNLWMSHAKLGDLYERAGALQDAEANYAVALTCAGTLQAVAPEDPERMRGVSVVLERLAGFSKASGDRERAIELCHRCLSLRREVYRLDPSSIEYARGLAVINDRLAELGAPGAVEYQRSAWEIAEDLHRRVPDNRELARDLAVLAWRLALFYEESGDDRSRQAWGRCAYALPLAQRHDAGPDEELDKIEASLASRGLLDRGHADIKWPIPGRQ